MTVAFLAKSPYFEEIKKGLNTGGLYNGYIATDKKLPVSYVGSWEDRRVLDELVRVHGGITYDCKYAENRIPMIPLTAIPEPVILDSLRVIGFDTLHWGDTKERWDFDAVKEETLDLLKQIEAL